MQVQNSSEQNLPAPVLILGGLAAFFLALDVLNISFWGTFWPLIILLPGVPFLYYALTGGKATAPLIFPGLSIAGLGALLFYQNATGHWESWAYAWALFPVVAGVGLQFMGSRFGEQALVGAGAITMTVGLWLFAILGLSFELLIFGGGVSIWAAALIGLVVWWMVRQRGSSETPAPAGGGKRKRIEIYEFGAEVSPGLKRRIEAALAESDDPQIV